MVYTPYSTLGTSLEKTHKLLKSIRQDLGWENREDQSLSALRVVLHAIRDRLSVEEAAHMAAQLPMVVRGLFYEGWNPTKQPIKTDREELLNYIQQNFNFDIKGGPENLLSVVWRNLRADLSEGEVRDIQVNMPKDIEELLTSKV